MPTIRATPRLIGQPIQSRRQSRRTKCKTRMLPKIGTIGKTRTKKQSQAHRTRRKQAPLMQKSRRMCRIRGRKRRRSTATWRQPSLPKIRSLIMTIMRLKKEWMTTLRCWLPEKLWRTKTTHTPMCRLAQSTWWTSTRTTRQKSGN